MLVECVSFEHVCFGTFCFFVYVVLFVFFLFSMKVSECRVHSLTISLLIVFLCLLFHFRKHVLGLFEDNVASWRIFLWQIPSGNECERKKTGMLLSRWLYPLAWSTAPPCTLRCFPIPRNWQGTEHSHLLMSLLSCCFLLLKSEQTRTEKKEHSAT